MKKSLTVLDHLVPILLGCGLAVPYLSTMAPGLTWANYGSDGGDLIAAAATGGVAHPNGYPVYLLVAQLFQLIPIGTLAYRTNLMSGAAMVAAALLVYGGVTRFLSGTWKRSSRLSGLAAACAFGLAPLVWSQAVITEVYALQAFFIALIFYLCMLPVSPHQERLCGLALGLALRTHLTSILLVPAVVLANAIQKRIPEDPARPFGNSGGQVLHLNGRSLLRQSIFLLAGSLIYLTLPIRAGSHPAVNWGDPITLQRFWWLISGKLYQPDLSGIAIPMLWERVRSWAALFVEQFGVAGLILGLMGLIVFFLPTRLHMITLWAAISFSGFAIVYGTTDSFVYLIPAFLSFAIWIGLGLDGVLEILSQGLPGLRMVFGLLFAAYIFGLAFFNGPLVDASHDRRAEIFGGEVMTAAPSNAILFATGDRAIFALWYFHFALHERPDMVVIANDLLPFDWYRGSLQSTYPDLQLPDNTNKPWFAAISQANSARPVCFLVNIEKVEINCR